MELREYLILLRRHAVAAVLVFLFAILASGAVTVLTPEKFSTQAQVFVSVSTPEFDLGYAAAGASYSASRVKTYAELVATPAVLGPASARLGMTINPATVSASVQPDTALVNVEVTDTDATRTAQVANAVATALDVLVRELETPLNGGSSPVKTTVVKQAETPTTPTQPRPLLNLALGILLGLAGAVTIVILLESLDQKVRTTVDVQELTDASPIGVLPFDKQAKKTPLSALSRRSTRSEGFRTIRTNLQFVNVDNPPRAIVITSAIPGEGKTTSAINLAIAMAQSGQRVLLVEADLRKPKIGEYLGIDSSIGLTSLLTFTAPMQQVLQPWHRDLLTVMPSGPIPPNPSELLASNAMQKRLEELKAMFDIVIIDAPPLLPVSDAAILAGIADGALFIAKWGGTRKAQLAASLEQLRTVGATLLGTVVNFAPLGKRGYYYGYGYGYGYRRKYGYGYGYGYGDTASDAAAN